VKKVLVGIVLGSDSDLPTVKSGCKILEELNIPYELTISSAHRTPKRTRNYIHQAEKKGIEVIIACAGGAAHLPGVIAAETVLPVIGVPMETKYLQGKDSLYSIVQMPSGIPVGTMAIGEAGAKNAAIYAAEILSLKYPQIRKNLLKYREKLTVEVIAKAKKVKESLRK
jgi:5-(carboxyamino)imidazole ribonucleotide mutase